MKNVLGPLPAKPGTTPTTRLRVCAGALYDNGGGVNNSVAYTWNGSNGGAIASYSYSYDQNTLLGDVPNLVET